MPHVHRSTLYNESDILIRTLLRYHDRYGHHSERVLADKIYRNRRNLAFCKEHGIRLSEPALGRHRKDNSVNLKSEYTDAVDRIEFERGFRLAKKKFGFGCIMTKLESPARSSIALSIIVLNLHRLTAYFSLSFLLFIFQKRREMEKSVLGSPPLARGKAPH